MNPKHIINVFRCKIRNLNKGVTISWRSNVVHTVFGGNNGVSDQVLLCNCNIGAGTYICKRAELVNVSIGKYCSIAPEVRNLGGNHPTTKYVSTHPAFFSIHAPFNLKYIETQKFQEYKYVDSDEKFYNRIGNDVWIGTAARLLNGVTIGDGAIVGAGSLVTKDVPPYAIVAGVPAKIIRYRFTVEQIKWLQALKWWEKDDTWIRQHANLFDDIERFRDTVDAISEKNE